MDKLTETQKRLIMGIVAVVTIFIVYFVYFHDPNSLNEGDIKGKKTYTSRFEGSNAQNIERRIENQYDKNIEDLTFEEYVLGTQTSLDTIEDEPEVIMEEDTPQKKQKEENVVEEEHKKTKIVYVDRPESPQTLPIENSRRRRRGFSSLNKNSKNTEGEVKDVNIEAVTTQDKVVKSGDIIMLRTLKKSIYNGIEIPKNKLVECRVTFSSNRCDLAVTYLPTDGQSLQVKLFGYGENGSRGLNMDNSVDRDLKTNAADDIAADGIGMIGVPYASSLLKSITSTKIQDPTITIKKGIRIYLKE